MDLYEYPTVRDNHGEEYEVLDYDLESVTFGNDSVKLEMPRSEFVRAMEVVE